MTSHPQLVQQGLSDHPGRPGQQHLHRSLPPADWRVLARNALASGSVASLASTLAVSCCSHWQSGSAVSGTNATSHWIWGERAKREELPSLRHTAVGYGIHHASSVFWAVFHEYATRRARRASTVAAVAAITAATAYVVDYHVVPRRLTPGFDSHLSRGAMVAAYTAFAIGLGATTWLRIRRDGMKARRGSAPGRR